MRESSMCGRSGPIGPLLHKKNYVKRGRAAKNLFRDQSASLVKFNGARDDNIHFSHENSESSSGLAPDVIEKSLNIFGHKLSDSFWPICRTKENFISKQAVQPFWLLSRPITIRKRP
jgi:hypothetical protein